MTRTTIVTAAGLALVAVLSAAPAQAQRDRVFVASYGNDSNPCTFGSPCKTFQAAVDAVAQGGEVTAIDSAGFGTITINHSVTITSPNGVEAGIATPQFGTAITINAASSDIVHLNGLTLDGIGGATYGIEFNSGGILDVQNSVIRNFGYAGVAFVPNASSDLAISNTHFANDYNGIIIDPTGSGVAVTAALDHVESENNNASGFHAVGTDSTGTIQATLSNSMFAHNWVGVLGESASGQATITVMVRFCTVSNSMFAGVRTVVGTTIRISKSTITGNLTGLDVSAGTIDSYGDNNIDGNGTNGSATEISLH